MNPPYGNLHLPILKKVVKEVVDKNNGQVVSLQPCRWLQDPLFELNKNSDANKVRSDIEGKIENIRYIKKSEACKYFDAEIAVDLGIFHLKKDGKINYTDLAYNRLGFNIEPFIKKYIKKNDIKTVLFKNRKYKNFVIPLQIIGGTGNRGNGKLNIHILRGDPYGVFINDRNKRGWTLSEAKSSNKRSVWGKFEEWPIIEFKNENEAQNFYDYCNLKPMLFFVCIISSDVHSHLSLLPFADDYSRPWTDERFYEHFNITVDEQKIIEETMEKLK
jgi:hypothetical protein